MTDRSEERAEGQTASPLQTVLPSIPFIVDVEPNKVHSTNFMLFISRHTLAKQLNEYLVKYCRNIIAGHYSVVTVILISLRNVHI